MKKIIINEDLIFLRQLTDTIFFIWDSIDREYPYASFKRWIRARKDFEETRNIYFKFLKEGKNESSGKIFG